MKSALKFGLFEVRPEERLVLRGSAPVNLGARAMDVLLLLLEHRHRVVSKAELLDTVWSGLTVEEANIPVQVSTIRKQLGAGLIATIPGRGYRFVAPLFGEQDSPASAETPAITGSNLRAELVELVDRPGELMNLQAALSRCRVVTVVGPGGIGKTTLARQLCRGLVQRFPDGLWWVDLAAASSAAQMLVAVAHTVRIQIADDGTDLGQQVLHRLSQSRMLLVLDNCEHLTEAVASLIQDVRPRAPDLQVLATSQRSLKVPGGLDFRLGPLALPRIGAALDEALKSGALELLQMRAKLVDQRFCIDENNLAQAVELVHRLDGNALAIEMAAARAPLISLSILTQHLEERFRILRGSPHANSARHRTLEAMLDWSSSLLEYGERELLQQLAVFAGSFGHDVVQAIRPPSKHDAWVTLDTLSSLVDKSLVQIESLEPPRYRLLESVRVYFHNKLRQNPRELAVAEEYHGIAMAGRGDEVEASFWTRPEADWLAHFAPDYDDLQTAFDRACARRDANCAARTGEPLLRLDHLRNLHSLRRQRVQAMYALLPYADAWARAIIWGSVASHGLISIEGVPRAQAAHHAVDAFRQLSDPYRLHFALGFLASERARQRDVDGARSLLAECHNLERHDWPPRRLMWGAAAASGVALHLGDGVEYRRLARRELELAEQAGAKRAAAWARLKLADAALMANDLDEAISLGEVAVAALRGLDQPSNLGLALSNLCAARLVAGRHGSAIAAAEALPLMWRAGWGYLLADGLALLAARAGLSEEAALLLGFADAWYVRHEDVRQPNEARLAMAVESTVKAGCCDPEAFPRCRLRGRELDDETARALGEMVVANAVGSIGPSE